MNEVETVVGKDMEKHSENRQCHAPAKWAAVVDDVVVPLPQQVVATSVIIAQASVPADCVLVRDHNSPDDVVLKDDGTTDLAEGNVFYRLRKQEVQPRGHCREVPKRAFIVDDRPVSTAF